MHVQFAKFRRTPKGARKLGGVCAGFAYFLGIQVWVTRLVTLLLILLLGHTVLIGYLLLWLLAPVWPALPDDFAARTND
jgi:phage shock protein PspC (stress-responsive transcriptional regulator)